MRGQGVGGLANCLQGGRERCAKAGGLGGVGCVGGMGWCESLFGGAGGEASSRGVTGG